MVSPLELPSNRNASRIGNTTPIAQEHEGMSCLVGGSLDWFLIDGDKGLKWFKYKLISLGMNQVKEQVIVQ